jgi:hypothetical protein
MTVIQHGFLKKAHDGINAAGSLGANFMNYISIKSWFGSAHPQNTMVLVFPLL